VIFKAMPTCFQ